MKRLRGAVGGEQIKSLATDVLQMVKETDILIDDLPGLEKTERCALSLSSSSNNMQPNVVSFMADLANNWKSCIICRSRVRKRRKPSAKWLKKQVRDKIMSLHAG